MTPTAGWTGLVSGTLAAVLVGVLSKDALGPMSVGAIGLHGPGRELRGRRCGVRRRHRGERGGQPVHRAQAGGRAARAGLLPHPEVGLPRPRRGVPGLVAEAQASSRRSRPSSSSSSTSCSGKGADMSSTNGTNDGHDGAAGDSHEKPHKAGAFDIRIFIASLIGIYGVVLVIAGIDRAQRLPAEEVRRGEHQPVRRHRHGADLGLLHRLGAAAAGGGPRARRDHRRPGRPAGRRVARLPSSPYVAEP